MAKQHRGQRNYHTGRAAEDSVARLYEDEGHKVLARRWRGAAGELDLVVERDGTVVFVEVKASRSFAEAALHVTARQAQRIFASAADFLRHLPGGQSTDARIDVALVDKFGRIDRIPNAIAG